MEWKPAVKCQILEKGTDEDYQSHLKSLICQWALLIFTGPHNRWKRQSLEICLFPKKEQNKTPKLLRE